MSLVCSCSSKGFPSYKKDKSMPFQSPWGSMGLPAFPSPFRLPWLTSLDLYCHACRSSIMPVICHALLLCWIPSFTSVQLPFLRAAWVVSLTEAGTPAFLPSIALSFTKSLLSKPMAVSDTMYVKELFIHSTFLLIPVTNKIKVSWRQGFYLFCSSLYHHCWRVPCPECVFST